MRLRDVWGHFILAVILAAAALLVARFRDFTLPPPPGYCVALLGLLAVVMTLAISKEPSKSEKAGWIGSAFLLMTLEMWAISHDRQKQDAKFRVMLNGVEDSIKTQTGGDSFAYVTLLETTPKQFELYVTSQGKYPLQQIYATMMDDERRLLAMQEYNKHPSGNWIAAINAADTIMHIQYLRPQSPNAPGGDVEPIMPYQFNAKDEDNLTIAFHGFNGDWTERLHLRRFNGKWHQALSVVGPTEKQAQEPFILADPDFPEGKSLAESDWPKPQAPPAAR